MGCASTDNSLSKKKKHCLEFLDGSKKNMYRKTKVFGSTTSYCFADQLLKSLRIQKTAF